MFRIETIDPRGSRIHSSGWNKGEQRGMKMGEECTSKCGLYRSNRSQTASVRTFKNDLM